MGSNYQKQIYDRKNESVHAPVNGFFGGGKSFVSNGYVIYSRGIDQYQPNLYAIGQGNVEIQRNLYDKSFHQLSNFSMLINKLLSIRDDEFYKEKELLSQKIGQLASTVTSRGAYSQYIDKIYEAFQKEDFTSAYTLLMKRTRDLDAIRDELKKNPKFSKHNDFWNIQFNTAMKEKLSTFFEKEDKKEAKLVNIANMDVAIEDLVDEYINKLILDDPNGQISKMERDSIQQIRNEYIFEVARIFKSIGEKDPQYINMVNVLNAQMDKLNPSKSKPRTINTTSFVTKTNKKRSIDTIVRLMFQNIALGKSGELGDLGAARRGKMIGINTGGLVRENLQGNIRMDKTDTIMFSTTETIQLDKMIDEIYKNKDIATKDKFDTIIKSLEQEQELFEDLFIVQVNTKSYKSNKDLQIDESTKFADIPKRIAELNGETNNIYFSDRLIFHLNNMVSQCLNENRKEYVALYIAAACVAWLWSDTTSMLIQNENDFISNKTIHLFNFNGIYVTASQIMDQTINNLQNSLKQNDSNLVQVKFKLPDPMSLDEYEALRSRYPVSENMTKDEWQNMLKKRWDEERDRVKNNGEVSISFRQNSIEDMLGNLLQLLG